VDVVLYVGVVSVVPTDRAINVTFDAVPWVGWFKGQVQLEIKIFLECIGFDSAILVWDSKVKEVYQKRGLVDFPSENSLFKSRLKSNQAVVSSKSQIEKTLSMKRKLFLYLGMRQRASW